MAEDSRPSRPLRRDAAGRSESEREISADGREIYTAYGSKDKLAALDIRKADGIGRAPAYVSFIDVIYSRRKYSGFVILFHHMMVTVKGRNLKDVVQALKARRCEFIEQISEEFAPPPAGEPVIESIEFDAKWQVPEFVE